MKKIDPVVSIIIPALNEESKIERTLCSLKNQSIDGENIELIVVDNGSTDHTVEIANKLADQVLVKPNCTVGAARNHGARIAKSGILVCTDADCEFEPEWLETGIRLLKENPDTAFGGGLKAPSDEKSWIEEYWILNQSGTSVQQQDLLGSCIFIRKGNFTLVSGFDEKTTSGEDSDISEKLRKSGVKICISPKLSVIHRGSPKNLYSFTKRQIWHSENYIKRIKKSAKDKMFYITIIYMLSVISLITGLTTNSHTITLASLLLLLALPSGLSYKRISRSKFKIRRFSDLIKIYTLDQLYIIGRCIGLTKGIAKPILKTKIRSE